MARSYRQEYPRRNGEPLIPWHCGLYQRELSESRPQGDIQQRYIEVQSDRMLAQLQVEQEV